MTKKKAEPITDAQHLRVLRAMSLVSTEGHASAWWTDKKQLHHDLKAIGIDAESKGASRRFGHYCKSIKDRPFSDGEGGPFILMSRWFEGDRAWRHGVHHPGRAERIARREKRAEDRALIAEQAEAIARGLKKGLSPAEAAQVVVDASKKSAALVATLLGTAAPAKAQQPGYFAPLSGADRAMQETRAYERWLETSPAPPPVRAPAVLEEPTVVIATPPPEDRSSWPKAWLIHGKPSYAPTQWEAPNEHYKNAEARQHYGKPDGRECASVVFNDRDPRNWKKKDAEE